MPLLSRRGFLGAAAAALPLRLAYGAETPLFALREMDMHLHAGIERDVDLDRWIGVNIRRICQLELDLSRPKRILDLGCGSGYFLYIAQLLGHSGVGLDMDRLPMFREITRLLGVRRVVQQIEAFRPLPNFGQKFDLITAFMICFNNHKMPGLWGVREWEFFLGDLKKHLRPRGRIWLELNQEYDGTFYTPELDAFFQKRGAKIDEHKIVFNSGLRAPASTSQVAR